jgi:branched-chain amino acid transport system permease protein
VRAIFKTDYDQDIRLFKHSGYGWSYGTLLAAAVLAPLLIGSYLASQIVFVFIYAMVGVGLLILTGFTGQVSLGHAAFLAIGAYTAAYLQRLGVPFLAYLPVAALLAGAVGALVGFPALRLSGIYLVIATIAFGFIVEEIAARWESVTKGNEGMRVKSLELFGRIVGRDDYAFYLICLALLVLVMIGALNLLRSPTGRAFLAIRDSETAARSLGINLAVYKVMAFSISAAVTGLAGCLYAHKLSFVSPEMFTLLLSLEFVIVIIIGGAGSLHGAVLGAIFVVMVDPFLTLLKDDVPRLLGSLAGALGGSATLAASIENAASRVGGAVGLKGAIYGLIIILFILFEPAGLYGRWVKLKLYFELFPLYKKATFRPQKTYVKSECNR